ncbi:hypothetical protein [Wolbachia endosymbiont of Folsomia candida]|uniref:hypothetical protein n=1 Tax=Wolbachia endosymbiont of Folsomia candida TaxID=169402 RepID=UPI000A77F9B2|nr:hypothetical protein [Wolbachia endosymbiont of Folsomia candida]
MPKILFTGLGAHGAENRSVLNIYEDFSTEATTQFPTEVEFRKKSIGYLWHGEYLYK